MKHWKILSRVLLLVVSAHSLVYAADKSANSSNPTKSETHEVGTIQTVYELHTGAKNKSLFVETMSQKIKEADEMLRKGECEIVLPTRHQKVHPLMSYSCKKPSAETDNFFRSLIAVTGNGGCARNAGDINLRTHSASLMSNCSLKYDCCTLTSLPVQCNLLTHRACNGCPY